jgi:hypothetical protein
VPHCRGGAEEYPGEIKFRERRVRFSKNSMDSMMINGRTEDQKKEKEKRNGKL